MADISRRARELGTEEGILGGAATFAKTGAGTLNLTGANTFTGATTVSGGTLVASAGSLANTASPANCSGAIYGGLPTTVVPLAANSSSSRSVLSVMLVPSLRAWRRQQAPSAQQRMEPIAGTDVRFLRRS